MKTKQGKTYSWCNRCMQAGHWTGEDCPLCGASMERAEDLVKPMSCKKGHIFDAHGSDEGDPNQCPRCGATGEPLSKSVGGVLILVRKAVDKVGGKQNLGFDFDAEPAPPAKKQPYQMTKAEFRAHRAKAFVEKHLPIQTNERDAHERAKMATPKTHVKIHAAHERGWAIANQKIKLLANLTGENFAEHLPTLLSSGGGTTGKGAAHYEAHLNLAHQEHILTALVAGKSVPKEAMVGHPARAFDDTAQASWAKAHPVAKAVDKRDNQTHGLDLFGSEFDAASLRPHTPSPKVPLPAAGKGRFRGKMADGLDDDETLLDRLDVSAHETRQMEYAHAGQLNAGHDTSLRYEVPKPKKTHWDAPIYVNGKPVPVRTPPHNDLLKSVSGASLTGQTRASLILVSKGVITKQFLNEVTAHAAPDYVTPQMIRDGLAAARAQTNPTPSPAQKEAGNYSKGKITLHGLTIAIENPKGSYRRGVSPDGKAWSVKMQNDYGYFTRVAGMGRFRSGDTNPLVGRDGDKV